MIYTARVLDQNRTLLGILDCTKWSYSRKISEATEVSITIPRKQTSAIKNCDELFAFMNPISPTETDDSWDTSTDPTQELAYFIEIYKAKERLITALIAKRDFTDTTIELKCYTEETLLTKYLTPAQYGRKYESWDIADIARDMAKGWSVQRIKAKSQWDAGTLVNVDTSTEPGKVLLSKSSGTYNASGSVTLTFSRPPNWANWERIRWVGDFDGAVAVKMQYSTDGGSTWSAEYVGGEPDTLGIEIATTLATTVMVRLNLSTSDTTSQDSSGNAVGVTPRLFAVEVIARTTAYLTVSAEASTGLLCNGLEIDKATPLAVMQAACSQVGKEFWVDNNTLYLGTMGIDKSNDIFLRKGTNMRITQLGDELAEVYNVIHAMGSGSGINRLEYSEADTTSVATYGVRETTQEFDTEDYDELVTLAQEYLVEHKDPIYAWKVKAQYPIDDEPIYGCGDTITITDGVIVTTSRIEQMDRSYDNGISVMLYLNKTRADLIQRVKPTYSNLTTFERPIALSVYPTIKGLIASVSRPVDLSRWDYTELHLSTTPDFTPSNDTLNSEKKATMFEVSGLSPGTRYYVKAINVANDGSKSLVSDERSAIPLNESGGISLSASSYVISYSARGELRTQEIIILLSISNLPVDDVIWTSSSGTLEQIELSEGVYDKYRRALICSTVDEDSAVISAEVTSMGITYNANIGITKVSDGIPSPLYLDARNEVPELTPEGPLVVGDFFLYVGEYDGPNTDPGDQGLNPPALEINEFVYGRIYEYRGKDALDVDQWQESRKSEHLAAAQKDALQIAKDSNTYMFVAVLVAQLGLFFDLIVAGVLKSPNYAENASGVPTAGFKLDGLKGLIKALGLEAYEAMIYGNLQASGFKTLQEEAGTTITTASITPTLWKHSEMEALIPDQDSLATVSGVINGFVFARAVRRANKRILQKSTGYEYEAISAGEEHFFTWLAPDIGWGMQCYVEYSGYYQGNFSYRRYVKRSGAATSNLPTSYSRAYIENIDWVGQEFCCWHKSEALFDFGAKPSYVNYHNIWTPQIFTGIVLTTEPVIMTGSPEYGACYDFNYLEIPPEPTAYYPNTKTWTIGSYNQNSIANYCSGTAFYNLFSSLAIGADGFCDGGQINVNGTLYTVTRLTKAANSITFYTSGGVITVNKFQEGTNVGVYTELAVTQAINFQAVVGGIEVKHIFPWGTQAGSPGSYDLGTSDARFNTLWLKILDVLNAVRFRSTLQVDGAASVASINTGGLGNFLIGQNLRTTDSPTFAAITAGTINTGYGDNEVFKISNEKLTITYDEVNMAAMDVGEIRFVSASLTNGDSYSAFLKTPSGGSYIVVGYGIGTSGNYIRSYTPGNTEIAKCSNKNTTEYFNGIVRRVS
jgi:hypothetical protein